MSITITPEAKSNLSMSHANKDDVTWDEATFTWDEAIGTWDVPGLIMTNETKSNLSMSFENKN